MDQLAHSSACPWLARGGLQDDGAKDRRAGGMSMLLQAMLFEKYGPRLNFDQVAEALGTTKNALHIMSSKGLLTLPTYLDNGKRWADVRDVASYLDAKRAEAA
jgi:hypothetical protein